MLAPPDSEVTRGGQKETERPGTSGSQSAASGSGRPRLPYMPGLDGLRALAVFAVLLYHAGLSWMPGGFLGVDVFFVISGYLITSLLLAEWSRHGRIDLRAFWLGRARRLLPGLFIMLAATSVFAVLFLPEEVAGLRGDLLAALGYVSNWYFIFEHQSYFEAMGRPPLLRHLWSLAVEEQFYVLWPLILTAGMLLLRRFGTLLVVLAGILGSTVLMVALFQPGEDPSRLYFGTDTRAAALMMGAAFAFLWAPRERPSAPRNLGNGRLARLRTWVRHRLGWTSPLLLDAAILLSLGGLIWFWLNTWERAPLLYRGGFAVVAIISAVLIVATVSPRARLGTALLGVWPLRWVGVRSYGIYLWHWPVLMVTRPGLDVPLDGWRLMALQVAATLALAALSYRFVERPVRSGAIGRAWESLRMARGLRRWGLRLGWTGAFSSVLVFCMVLSVAMASADPPQKPDYLSKSQVHVEKPKSDEGEQASVEEKSPKQKGKEPTTAANSDGSQKPRTREKTAPAEKPTVTAIGDSVMLRCASVMRQDIPNLTGMDAEVSLHVNPAIAILQKRRAAGQLGDIVIVHLGTNGGFSEKQFDQIMDALSGVDKVVFVNVSVPRYWENPTNEVISEGVKQYPKAVLVDWHSATEDRPELFGPDGIHPLPEGVRLYVKLIKQAIEDE